MKRSSKLDQIGRARAAWGEGMPPEVLALANACKAGTSRAVAMQIGYSDAVVSQVLARTYRGDLPKVFTKIRGALMGETVSCPIVGDITTDQCLVHQGRPFSTANPALARLYRACRRCCHRQQKDVA